ncbi:hypothetical protein LUZ60_014705 [Juncus effusus]|nr:hypothetical protein LUZ60_014705 [Juncus effusus]
MEEMRRTRRRRKAQSAEETAAVLRKSWYRLRLSVRDPARVPAWDAIVLTAASPEQAALYTWQLDRARRIGRIADSTVALAVPDPDGARIGSGAATLHAIYTLARHLVEEVKNDSENSVASMVKALEKKNILLIHAGGDSKRVPWANPMGKVFLPLPFLAGDNPDGPVPLLFDHILAISSCARQSFKNQGGILIMTGDVLPCFDASSLILPEDSSCIITVPITLDIASNHGVIVAKSDGNLTGEDYKLSPVENLLQKPTMSQLLQGDAILEDGRALLDTGVIAARGIAWEQLVRIACNSSQEMIRELIDTRKEMSLYEDLVAAWVPSKHEWLKTRPFGSELISSLGGQRMFSFCSYDLSFLHFGTSNEVLDHFSGANRGLVSRRHLSLIPETTACDIATSAVILSSKISPGVAIGEDSLVYDSSISGRVQIGSQSIVVGLKLIQNNLTKFILPDRNCIWQVPLINYEGDIIIYCGLNDNPKKLMKENGTFCGKPWRKIISDLNIKENDLWTSEEKCLWNAKIFPMVSLSEMLQIATWLIVGPASDESGEEIKNIWKNSTRLSLEELHKLIDYNKMCVSLINHQADLSAEIARACVKFGLIGRDLSQLCDEIVRKEGTGVQMCEEILGLFENGFDGGKNDSSNGGISQSRGFRVKTDLLRVCGDEKSACEMETQVWAAVATETASAVKYDFEDNTSPSKPPTDKITKSTVSLPVRVDFVGGWSDTPPYSLHHPGCVLNMAISLQSSLPISSTVRTTYNPNTVSISDDSSSKTVITNPASISAPFDPSDPFRLVKSALIATNVINHEILLQSGLEIETRVEGVPRGSGLGTSSILAAAVVRGILDILGEESGDERVVRKVLEVEQIMGTGGGWQDQVGAVYKGIKCSYSFPGESLGLRVDKLSVRPSLVKELEERLLVIFTGQVRLASQVLQKVVTRYLRRDSLLISSIKRLAELAKIGRDALMNNDIDELGSIMLEAWRLHQELDPFCSNTLVDKLFAFCEPYCCGYKLVGAGGGGFALILAKGKDSARELRSRLEESEEFDVNVYDWSICLE